MAHVIEQLLAHGDIIAGVILAIGVWSLLNVVEHGDDDDSPPPLGPTGA